MFESFNNNKTPDAYLEVVKESIKDAIAEIRPYDRSQLRYRVSSSTTNRDAEEVCFLIEAETRAYAHYIDSNITTLGNPNAEGIGKADYEYIRNELQKIATFDCLNIIVNCRTKPPTEDSLTNEVYFLTIEIPAEISG